MPSLLVTRKMSPALAARVQASVDGRRAAPGARLVPRAISLFRMAALTVTAVCVVWIGVSYRRASQALEARRAELTERIAKESAEVSPEDSDAVARALPWVPLFVGAHTGDAIADELRPAGAFAAVLAKPTIYLRGALPSLSGRVNEAAASSLKDAFVLCLNAPPASRTEQALRAKARTALEGRGEGMRAISHVERFHDAMVGLPFLGVEFQNKVRAASSRQELRVLQRDFERAPIARAKAAARATSLIVVVDEPNPEPGPTELDGERPHDVRVGVVDLRQRKVLINLRRRVDPSFISVANRAEYASGIDSCALALDVHAAVVGTKAVAGGE